MNSTFDTTRGFYSPIIYFGRYATCSHDKDGGRTHIQSRETIGEENHVTCVKLRPHVNFLLRLEPLPRHVFSINTSSSNTLSLFYTNSSQRIHALSSMWHSSHSSTGVKSKNMDWPRRHSFLQYTLTMWLFPHTIISLIELAIFLMYRCLFYYSL